MVRVVISKRPEVCSRCGKALAVGVIAEVICGSFSHVYECKKPSRRRMRSGSTEGSKGFGKKHG